MCPNFLKVHDAERWVAGAELPSGVVRAAFEYAAERNVPLAGFLGDECVTLRMTPELEVRQLSRICFLQAVNLYAPEFWELNCFLLAVALTGGVAAGDLTCKLSLKLNAHMLHMYLLMPHGAAFYHQAGLSKRDPRCMHDYGPKSDAIQYALTETVNVHSVCLPTVWPGCLAERVLCWM